MHGLASAYFADELHPTANFSDSRSNVYDQPRYRCWTRLSAVGDRTFLTDVRSTVCLGTSSRQPHYQSSKHVSRLTYFHSDEFYMVRIHY